jgi:phospholipid/cholesterol/gamma-HCH transport system substrate-binding protein
MLSKSSKIKLAIFGVIALITLPIAFLHFTKVPSAIFGIGRYTVTLELPQSGGLYSSANVTYRGTEVGKVESLHLTDTGIEAELSLKSDIHIPSDLRAEVHSHTPIGEQYVELLPRNGTSPPLKSGDVIPLRDTSLPPDISTLVAAADASLKAIPRDNLQTVIDESYIAVGGLGPELSRLVRGSTDLAIEARKNLDSLTSLIDQSQPVLESQNHTSAAIQAWASQVATVTDELKTHDAALAGIVDNGGPALAEVRQVVERLQPTLPILLANLASVAKVGLTYQNDLEQTLVLLPQLVANHQAAIVANADTKQAYSSFYINLNLNLNTPAPCTTGYLPPQQLRSSANVDAPDLPPGDLYCRVPQDSAIDVRGVRNIPCETVPGKRAPTVKMCESDEPYVPLNDGYNWKGDPNATLSGQDIPQLAPGVDGAPPAAPPIAAAEYDPATGTYIGPDGKRHTNTDLTQQGPQEKTWQSMLMPPTQN